MSKKVLIVEVDSAVSNASRTALEASGFSAQETADAKECVDLIRGSPPDLVVLAVDLGPGQSGYLICSRLKKDSELKNIPVVIIGSPDGFEKHSKLKTTRADDYVAKPFEPEELVARIGRLIGFPDPLPAIEDEPGFAELLDADGTVEPDQVVSIDQEATIQGDPELALIDDAFDREASAEASHEANPVSAWDQATEAAEYQASAEAGGFDAAQGEDHHLSTQVEQLQQALASAQTALDEAQRRAEQAEARARGAESAGGKPAPPGKSDKDYFALRDAVSKRDRDLLQLKTQLTEREKEILELHDQETRLEHQIAETAASLSQRESELEAERGRVAERDGSLQRARGELGELRNQLEAAKREHKAAQGQLQQARSDLESARSQLATQASVFSQDAESLRNKIREMESTSVKNEERIDKLHQRIKGDEKLREKTKKALSIALQLLDEQQDASDSEDEPAAA